MSQFKHYRPVAGSVLMIAAALQAHAAHAQDGDTSVNVGTVSGGASHESSRSAKQKSAIHQAPSKGSLKSTQPKSTVNKHYIDNVASPLADYNEIIDITPSVVNLSPNGPGLGNSAGLSIRGFQDGQFNLTWDGIPVGDANDFTHHSADYFMPQDIGGVDIDRGPGNGATVGYATFGGTVGIHTKAPLDQTATTVYGSYGSFASRLYGAEFDTGTIHDYGDARAFLDYRQVQSNGYLSGADLQRENLFFKAEKPFGTSTLLTVVAMKNRINGSYAGLPGATSYPYVAVNNGSGPYTSNLPGQMQVFGPNYGYSSNPKSQAYSGYFPDPVSTDFEYIGLNTRFAGVHLDDKVYTYAYYHNGQSGADPNGGNYDYGTLNGPFGSPGDGTFPAGAGSTNGTQCDGTTCLYPDNVPGDHGAILFYRNWGNLLRLTQNLGPGQLGYGLWANYQSYYRFSAAIDLTNGGGYNFNPSKSPQSAIARQINGTFVVAQPYLQYAWHVTPALTVTPGIKYAWFRRSDKAPINQKTKKPSNYAQVFKKFLPSIDIHYLLQRHWSAYIQAAKGYLAPNENLFYVPNPAVLTLPRFDVHQNVDNFLMDGERDGQESVGTEPAVHG